jgi:hypothetical protein
MARLTNGCAFGQVTREKVESTHACILEIKQQLDEMDDKMTELFNHQSSRLPNWATAIGMFLSALCSGLILWALTR